MASEMRVACVLCASHPCVRGEAPPPTPMCPFSSGISLASILLATSDRTCVSAVGGSREEPHGEEPSGCAGLSWLLCGVSDLGLDSTSTTIHQNARTVTSGKHSGQTAFPGRRPPTRPGRRRARAREPPRNRCSAHPHRGRPLADGNTRAARARVTHLRLTLQLGLVHRRVYRTQPTGAHENVRVPVPADRPRTNAPDVTANPTQAARRVPRPKDTRRAVAGSRVGPSGPQLLRTDP
jgi:hypothetical protein